MFLNNINNILLSSHIHIITKNDKIELSNYVLKFLNEANNPQP